MKETDGLGPHEVTPEDALHAISAHRGPLIVDFDETLYLRNSTSDFLSSARPALLAFVLVKLVDVIRPWRFGSNDSELRDMWRVRIVMTLLPWTVKRWRKQATTAAKFALNERLAEAVRAEERPVVVSTLGFEPIVRPLLDGFGLDHLELVAMDPWDGEQYRQGKLAIISETVGQKTVSTSAVVTDSIVDRELLEAGELPLLVRWPEAGPGETFNRVYYPGRYLTKVKRPGSGYIRRKILQEDILLWILSTVWIAENALTTGIGLVVLAVSFWAVYESGYVDNDHVADQHEEHPALTTEFRQRKVTFPAWVPFLWATATGVLGLTILRFPELPSVLDLLAWAVVLWVSVGVFRVYNRLDKGTRVLLFPMLQLLRAAAFVVVAPTIAIAVLAITLHVIMRWVSYYVYRTVPGGWPGGPELVVVRLLTFVTLGLVLISQQDWSELWSATTISLVVWHLFLARTALPEAIKSAHRIDR